MLNGQLPHRDYAATQIRMIIIHSGTYVPLELQAEFGVIPPCMLPLANRKLIEHQARALAARFPEERIVVSLPEAYALTAREAEVLRGLGVRPVRTPAGASLCGALAAILEREGGAEGMRLLRGDVLLPEPPELPDAVGIVPSPAGSGEITATGDAGEDRWAGFFAFSSPKILSRCLTAAQDSFNGAVHAYARERSLRFVPVGRRFALDSAESYFRSRAALPAQRAFNSLEVSGGVVTKSGTPAEKIEAEAWWFRQAPPRIAPYLPRLIAGGQPGEACYRLEYLPLSPLNEVFVHGRKPSSFWEYAFDRIADFFRDAAGAPDAEAVRVAARRLWGDKTRQRLRLFTEAEGIDEAKPLRYAGKALPPLRDICEECLDKTLALPDAPGILHGDLCLSNIFIDMRSGAVKLIDPRGLDHDGAKMLYGDQKYDLAKLAHSCIGLYDFIMSGYCRLETRDAHHYALRFVPDEPLAAIQAKFREKRFIPQCSVEDILPLTILLFLSMLPLHGDDHGKQRALFANALRLYGMMRAKGACGASSL
jgi:hypothetical protein